MNAPPILLPIFIYNSSSFYEQQTVNQTYLIE